MAYTLTQLQELELDGRNRFAGNELFVPISDIMRAPNVSNRQFNIKDYGAVGDASTDCTAAWLAACAAADVAGGDVIVPPGIYRITQGYTFIRGINVADKSVYIRGGGSHCSVLDFRPTTVTDNCIQFGNGTANYYGGGVSDLQIVNGPRTCTGAGICFKQALMSSAENVEVVGFAGTAGGGHGKGCLVSVGNNPQEPCQHLYFANVGLSQGQYGLYGHIGSAAVFSNLKINQNVYQGMNITGGNFAWFGGLLQDSDHALPACQLGDGTPAAVVTSTFHTIHVECTGTTAPIFDFNYCSLISLNNLIWNGPASGQLLCKTTNCQEIVIENMNIYSNDKFLESVTSTGRVRSVTALASAYTIDASSKWDFDGCGHFGSGFQLQGPPASTSTTLAVGGGLQLKSHTTAQRDALTSVQAGTLIFNTTTVTVQVWTGAAWVSL